MLKGPGIGDDCRGLTVVLAVLRALDAAQVQTPGTLTFVGTVGEEGLGDLRGVKHLFDRELKGRIDKFISIDGTGTGITYAAVGSRRYRITFKGPGGHSYGAFGLSNPVHALGRAIARIAEFTVPKDPKTTFNVGESAAGPRSTRSRSKLDGSRHAVGGRRGADGARRQLPSALDTALPRSNDGWGGRGRLELDRKVGRGPPGAAGCAANRADRRKVGRRQSGARLR